MVDRNRVLMLALRQALITFLCALDDYLGLPRCVPNRRERRIDKQPEL